MIRVPEPKTDYPGRWTMRDQRREMFAVKMRRLIAPLWRAELKASPHPFWHIDPADLGPDMALTQFPLGGSKRCNQGMAGSPLAQERARPV